jgi:MinD-like ATPase involved in chromosome partitioning or flagellar assembly
LSPTRQGSVLPTGEHDDPDDHDDLPEGTAERTEGPAEVDAGSPNGLTEVEDATGYTPAAQNPPRTAPKAVIDPPAPQGENAQTALAAEGKEGEQLPAAPARRRRRHSRPPLPKVGRQQASWFLANKFVRFVLAMLAAAAVVGSLFGLQKLLILEVAALLVCGAYELVARRPKKHALPEHYPTRGFRGKGWSLIGRHLYARFGWTRLSQRSKQQRYNDNHSYLRKQRWLQFIVAFCNKKGGSNKTGFCAWLAALDAYLIKLSVLAFDVNESGGQTAARLGVKRNSEAKDRDTEGTIELRNYLEACDRNDLATSESFIYAIDWHEETGVMVIASDAASTKVITKTSMERGMKRAKEKVRRVYTDCGNELTAIGNVVAVTMSQVLVFCGNSHMSGSTVDLKRLQEGKPDDLMNTMNTCIQLGHEQKVKAGIIVIIGKPRDRKAYADHYNFPVERVFVVPYNRYMKSGSKVSLRKVPLAMRVVLSDILVAIVKAADKVDQDLNDAEEELTTTSDV